MTTLTKPIDRKLLLPDVGDAERRWCMARGREQISAPQSRQYTLWQMSGLLSRVMVLRILHAN